MAAASEFTRLFLFFFFRPLSLPLFNHPHSPLSAYAFLPRATQTFDGETAEAEAEAARAVRHSWVRGVRNGGADTSGVRGRRRSVASTNGTDRCGGRRRGRGIFQAVHVVGRRRRR